MVATEMKTSSDPPPIPPQSIPTTEPSTPEPILSTFERVIASNPPILDSLFAQLTTQDALHIYHTSSYLRTTLRKTPASWRFISWRLFQPQTVVATQPTNTPHQQKQSSNYALDHLLINVINPFSTCLQSLELDNTAVSGSTLSQTVLVLRRDTLQHLSVRGCKNVSLKYHINPWLQMHALAKQAGVFPYDKLALKSLYTYRCRHHRRRPYLPQSLNRKESDSEPTHELVKACHELGIWTDTAWCTTPGPRCFRRRGYVTMRTPQDPREVWVVFDRLWRSKNWLGPVDSVNSYDRKASPPKPDPRLWESQEIARKGEATGIGGDGKDVPMHLRASHRIFVEGHQCHQCGDAISERCEQCSIMMHCSGCRKTLCASCAFDRPYLRNKHAPAEDRNKFWWAPGCAVSPCSMQDSDTNLPTPHPAQALIGPPPSANSVPSLRLKWCCTEPTFSGGGGISFPNASNRNADSIRAAPLPKDQGWEEAEFAAEGQSTKCDCPEAELDTDGAKIAGRWLDLPDFFKHNVEINEHGAFQTSTPVPRILCGDCYSSETWKLACKACNTPICVKHDFRDRMRIRICGYRDLSLESREYLAERKRDEQAREHIGQGAPRARQHRGRITQAISDPAMKPLASGEPITPDPKHSPDKAPSLLRQSFVPLFGMSSPMSTASSSASPLVVRDRQSDDARIALFTPELDLPLRPSSRGSLESGSTSRASSPGPSAETPFVTPAAKAIPRKMARKDIKPFLSVAWQGCYSAYCSPFRQAGDNRRRCTGTTKACAQCKVIVCDECIGKMEAPCPCKGCRASLDGADPATTPRVPSFFCGNCRWSRMLNGQCKRLTEAYLEAQADQAGRARRNKKPSSKLRHSTEHRLISGSATVDPDAIASFIGDFAELRPDGVRLTTTDTNQPEADAANGEIEEIEHVGILARELITRLQGLRGQFQPGSPAARAIPDVRLMNEQAQSIIQHAQQAIASADSEESGEEVSN